ncbi:MAG TPA: response regulator [Novosphingobium sp.]|nr:response regulator [Novosphingobium sp.]
MIDSIDLLVVDDDDITVEMVERFQGKARSNFRVIPASDGREALDILEGRSQKQVQRPFIVLLDLNMPRMNGFEFLKLVREESDWGDAVVFVLSTSDSEQDLQQAYRRNVAGYMIKSGGSQKFGQLLDLLDDYASSVRLPE